MMAVSSRNLIIVTGTPGVGKTAISRLLAKAIHGTHIDCGKLALRRKLTKGYDRQDQSYIIDETRLARELWEIVSTSRSHVVLEGHIVSRVVGLNPSIVFVLRCHPKLLVGRLRRKKYRAKKIAENIAAEILDVCLKEAVESYGADKTVELDVTHKSQRQVASMMLRILNGKAKLKRGHIDWIRRLERERGLLNVLTYITSSADTIVG
jgi:adenylate kinase